MFSTLDAKSFYSVLCQQDEHNAVSGINDDRALLVEDY